MTVALAFLAACANDATSPSALFRNGADDPIPQNRAGTTKTVVQIVLTAAPSFPGAKGKAKFTVNGDQRELETRVEEVLRLAGMQVTLWLGGASLGSATVDATGRAGIALNTRLGDGVPGSVAGQAMEIRLADGTLIVSGSF